MKEIEIPEGYEARIEGNKVVLEPKESEDEKIRKQLIDEVKEQIDHITAPVCCNSDDLKRLTILESWLAYLEKQKEQNPKFNVGDTIRLKNSCAEYTIESISDGKYYCKGCSIDIDGGNRDYELVRQKSAGWSEEDETCLEDALWCVTKTRHFVAKDACDLDACRCAERWLESLPERFSLQPKQEWDERDKYILNNIHDFIKENTINPNRVNCAKECLIWLDSLLKRGNLLPRQEWGEEDEKAIKEAIRRIEQLDHYWNRPTDKKLMERLKSLRPHWKPSQEQMEALLELEETYVLEHEKTQETARLYVVIKSLREQLSELRKGES